MTSNKLLKTLLQSILGSIGDRPRGAKNCDYLGTAGLASSYGMPSGHVQTFAFVATLLALSIREQRLPRYILLGVLLIGSMYARVLWQKCHTFCQSVLGALVGIILALLVSRYIKNPFDEKSTHSC